MRMSVRMIFSMPLAIGIIMLVPIITMTMYPIIERGSVRRFRTDSQFDQDTAPPLAPITSVMIADIAHTSSGCPGNLQSKTHMPPVSTAASIIIIERFRRNIVFHAETPTKIRQVDRSIPIGISDKNRKPVLCRQGTSKDCKKYQQTDFSHE